MHVNRARRGVYDPCQAHACSVVLLELAPHRIRPIRRGQDLDHEVRRDIEESIPPRAASVPFMREEQDSVPRRSGKFHKPL